MQLESRTDPFLWPDPEQVSVLRLGLQSLNPREWMVADEDLALFQQHKRAQAEQRFESVYQALPESESAQREFADNLLSHLSNDHATQYGQKTNTLIHHPSGLHWPLERRDLWHSSLWVQEDICLLQNSDDQYRLTAASLCSPSNWKLADKIGRGLDVIHDPVPGYQEQLAMRVNRLLDALKPNKPLLRYNWSIQSGNELFWREDNAPGTTSEEKYWRVERQTLVRLPKTGAIVFGIRIFLHSFARMSELLDFDKAVDKLVARLPDAERHYKNLESSESPRRARRI